MALALEEDRAALEAALAFLDSCESDSTDTLSDLSSNLDLCFSNDDLSTSSSPSTASSHSSAADVGSCTAYAPASAAAMQAPPATIAPATPRQRAARPRKTPKSKILALRTQVRDLTVLLAQLEQHRKRIMHRDSTSQRDSEASATAQPLSNVYAGSIEFANAVLELRKLHEAEALNLKLKVEWQRQIELAKRLETLMRKPFESMDMELLFDKRTKPHDSMLHDISTHGDGRSPAFPALDTHLERMRCEMPTVCAYVNERGANRVFTNSRAYQNLARLQTLEFVTNTPLACSVADLKMQIWEVLSQQKDDLDSDLAEWKQKAHDTGAVHIHDVALTLECQFGTIDIRGQSGTCTFIDEPRRHVLAYTSALTLAGTDLQFRESVWLFMSELASTGGGSGGALLQTCYRMQPEPASATAQAAAAAATYFQDFVLQAQSETMRTEQLHLQSALLQKFGSVQVSAVTFDVDATTAFAV